MESTLGCFLFFNFKGINLTSMKTYIVTFIIATVLIIGCDTQKGMSTPGTAVATGTANDTVRIANEELEYEVIIIDPGFNSWLRSRARPRGFYSQQHLENKNRFWVTEWNNRFMQPQRYGDLYLMQIDYSGNIDYGYEVNYLLYNYLVYFQQTTGQKLGGVVPEF
jgi:hypothetical protein